MGKITWARLQGAPKRGSKSRFHACFFAQITPQNAWNLRSCQVYSITPDFRLIFHPLTLIFSSNSCFHALKYVQSRHHGFPLGGPSKQNILKIFQIFKFLWGNSRNVERPTHATRHILFCCCNEIVWWH